MKKIFELILHHRKTVLMVFGALLALSALAKPLVGVNYDLNDYLPAESPSTLALDEMMAQYETDIPNTRIMVPDVTITEAMKYKAQIAQVPGVLEVLWLDDSLSILVPLESQDQTIVEQYYKEGNALFTVTIQEQMRVEAMNALREVIGDEGAMTGAAINTATATQSTLTEISKIVAIAIPIVFLILILTTTSWLEPLIVLASIGVAILINSGSNLLFGEISFVTNGAGNILQLAVSLDYSVFLLHRFEENRHKGMEAEPAMLTALSGSAASILSSGMTTVIGFAALILMRFRIGPDLGMALAKGVFISLITVFTLLPVITLYTYKWMERLQHKPLMPTFEKFGLYVRRQMLPMVVIFTLLIVPGYLAQQSNSFYYGSEHIFDETTKLGQDTAKIDAIFGKSSPMVLMVPKGDLAKESALSQELHGLVQVGDIISYVDNAGPQIPYEFVPGDTLSQLISEEYSRMIINVQTSYEGPAAFTTVETIRRIAQEYYPDNWYLAGESPSTYDLMDTITADNTVVNLIAIAAVFFVLVISFKSPVIPILLVVSIETAIWLNLSLPYFRSDNLFFLAYLIIGSIQLGATVDYAILTTHRYLELRTHMTKKDAVPKTIEAVTVSILTSGLSMTVVGFLLGTITTHGVMKQLGILLGIGTIFSMIIVFFVLPGLLYLLDGFMDRTKKNLNFYRPDKDQDSDDQLIPLTQCSERI